MTPVDVIQKKEPKDMAGYNKMTGFKQGAADLAPLNLDLYMYVCERSEQEKIRLSKIEKKINIKKQKPLLKTILTRKTIA